MQKLIMSLMCAVVLVAGLAQAQQMPGPSATLLNAVVATTTSSGFAISGYGITTFQTVSAASATGTVAYQGSLDNTNYTQMTCWLTGTTTAATSTVVAGTTASAFVSCNTDGIPMVRAVLSPYTAGTFTVLAGVSALPRTK